MDTTFLQNFYCKLSIDDHQLIPKNIVSCTIREFIFDVLPRIELTIHDDGYLSEVFPIKDDSVLEIEFGVNPDDPNIISTKFDIVDKNFTAIEINNTSLIAISGVLKTEDFFFPIRNRSFSNKTSAQVISILSKESDLIFKKNLNLNPIDLMTWLQINQTNFDFIKHILVRAYSNDDSLFCFANLFGELNFTSIKSELRNIPKSAQYGTTNFSNYELQGEDKNIIWYNAINSVNFTKSYNYKYSYGMNGSYFDSLKNNEISLNSNYYPLSENIFKSKNKSVNKRNFPIFTNNIHPNYFKAQMQNDYFKSLFSLSTALNINPLSDVKLFDIIDLRVESLFNKNTRDEVQSGEYFVGGITHHFGAKSLYTKQLTIHRNGFNAPQII